MPAGAGRCAHQSCARPDPQDQTASFTPRRHPSGIRRSMGKVPNVGPWFSGDMLHDVGQFFDHDMPIEEVVFVPAGLVPWIALRGMQNAFALVQKNWLWMSVESFVVGVLTIVSFLCNLGRRTSSRPAAQPVLFERGACHAQGGCSLARTRVIEAKAARSSGAALSLGLGASSGRGPCEAARRGCGKEMSAGLRIGTRFRQHDHHLR